MLSAAISSLTTLALTGHKLDLSFLSNPFVILLIGFLSFYFLILFFIRLFNH